MSANGFREDELVSRKVKVGHEWQTRVFPVVGGRLRLAHEDNETLSLQTELVSWDGHMRCFAAQLKLARDVSSATARRIAREIRGSPRA